jgi:hypothetical protein
MISYRSVGRFSKISRDNQRETGRFGSRMLTIVCPVTGRTALEVDYEVSLPRQSLELNNSDRQNDLRL